MAGEAQGNAQLVAGDAVAGIHLERSGEPGDGLLELSGDEGEPAQLSACRHQGGLELQRGPQHGPRLVQLAPKPVGDAQVVTRQGIIRSGGDRLTETVGRLVLAARPEQREAPCVQFVHAGCARSSTREALAPTARGLARRSSRHGATSAALPGSRGLPRAARRPGPRGRSRGHRLLPPVRLTGCNCPVSWRPRPSHWRCGCHPRHGVSCFRSEWCRSSPTARRPEPRSVSTWPCRARRRS